MSINIDKSEWKDVWTLAEFNHGKMHGVSFELLAWGRDLADDRGCKLCSVVLTDEIGDAELNQLFAHGADKIYVVTHPALKNFITEMNAKVVRKLVEDLKPEVFLAAATTTGRTVMPYVAIQTRAGLTADCTGLAIDPETGELHQTRPAIGGNIMATIKTPEARPQMATVRPKSKKPLAADESRTGDVVRVEMPEDFFVTKMTLDTFIANDLNEVPVEEADIVVAGGAGVGNLGNFALLEDLADVLGGTVGVSRVPVDQGWRPYIKQVGMSGKTIAPKLYIACGISGTVHHIVGMQTSETIVAINTDPEAKIFQVADLGVVGDLTKLLPKLTAKIKEEKERMAA